MVQKILKIKYSQVQRTVTLVEKPLLRPFYFLKQATDLGYIPRFPSTFSRFKYRFFFFYGKGHDGLVPGWVIVYILCVY